MDNSQAADERSQRNKEKIKARRAKLQALGPQFVDVIKLGQVFTQFTPTSSEQVFVWFHQEPGTAGTLYWEPVVDPSENNNEVTMIAQPKICDPSRNIKFAAISDIFMGRTNDVLDKHQIENIKLCITFTVHPGNGESLHLMARSKAQIEAWNYGIQHILKETGFCYVEADTNPNPDSELFERYTSKQLVRLITKNDPIVANLNIQATLTRMNAGQNFKRFLPDNRTEDIHLFFCSDGTKGILFWGPRNNPEGYLPLRSVSDMWLGKHGLITQTCAEQEDASACVSLASRKALLAICAPTRAIMCQWIYGIHTLLTGSDELLAEINRNHNHNQNITQAQNNDIYAAKAAVEDIGNNDAIKDGDADFRAEASAALRALRNLSLASGQDFLDSVDYIDESCLDQSVIEQADAAEAQAEKLRTEMQRIRDAKERRQEDAMKSFILSDSAAESAIAVARQMREVAVQKAAEDLETSRLAALSLEPTVEPTYSEESKKNEDNSTLTDPCEFDDDIQAVLDFDIFGDDVTNSLVSPVKPVGKTEFSSLLGDSDWSLDFKGGADVNNVEDTGDNVNNDYEGVDFAISTLPSEMNKNMPEPSQLNDSPSSPQPEQNQDKQPIVSNISIPSATKSSTSSTSPPAESRLSSSASSSSITVPRTARRVTGSTTPGPSTPSTPLERRPIARKPAVPPSGTPSTASGMTTPRVSRAPATGATTARGTPISGTTTARGTPVTARGTPISGATTARGTPITRPVSSTSSLGSRVAAGVAARSSASKSAPSATTSTPASTSASTSTVKPRIHIPDTARPGNMTARGSMASRSSTTATPTRPSSSIGAPKLNIHPAPDTARPISKSATSSRVSTGSVRTSGVASANSRIAK